MAFDLIQERQQAHALIDLLPSVKLIAVRSLLEVMLDDDEDELTEADRRAIHAGLDSAEKHGTVSMEEVLSDFGLSIADFEKMAAEPDRFSPPGPMSYRSRPRQQPPRSLSLIAQRIGASEPSALPQNPAPQ